MINSQALISQEFEKQKKTIETITKKNMQLEENATKLITENKNKDQLIKNLKCEVNNLEQYGRWDMLIIKGVPYWNGEDTDKIIINLAKLLNIVLTVRDIYILHQTFTGEKAGIIVKFNSHHKRNEFYSKWKEIHTKKTF